MLDVTNTVFQNPEKVFKIKKKVSKIQKRFSKSRKVFQNQEHTNTFQAYTGYQEVEMMSNLITSDKAIFSLNSEVNRKNVVH